MSSIVIVSGMPRSGTSMLMKALKDGGLEPLTDGVRTPNEDNPNGYFEYEPVKNLKNDNSWMKDAIGKSVKIIYKHLNLLPTDYQYKIIFVERNIDEIIDRLSDLMVNMMLMSVKKISNDQRFLMDRLGLNQDDELKF